MEKNEQGKKITFHTYPKIYTLGKEENGSIFSDPNDEIIIEEKIDGANFRFMLKNNTIIFGSRTGIVGESKTEKGKRNWQRCISFIKEKLEKNLGDNSLLSHLIFYGECIVKHTLSYDWENIPPYLGYDIFDANTGKFLDYDTKKAIFQMLELPMVPLIYRIKALEIKQVTDAEIPQTKYPNLSSKDLQAEGIVFKNYSKQVMAKYVRERFKEDNKEAFGESKKFAENDSERIVAIYCTNARIEKCAFKLIEEGNKLDMSLMSTLMKLVILDIYEENWKEICFSNWSVNFKDIRKKIAKRILAVLQQMMVNQALIKKGKV